MDIKLDDKIKELVKLNIEKDLKSFGCKDIDRFLNRYSSGIIEALEEIYSIELEYLHDEITRTK